MLSNKISIFPYKKVKVKKYLLLFGTYSFSNFFFFFQRFSSVPWCVKQFLGGLHLFWDFFFVVKDTTVLYLKKPQVKTIVFNKKAVVKFLGSPTERANHETFVKLRSEFFVVNVSRIVCWICFSFDCKLMVKL